MRELERELARTARKLVGPSPAPSQSAYHRPAHGRGSRSLFPAVATASSRAVAGLVAACMLGAGGAVAATTATGSANPVVWGSTVSRAVATCRGSLPSGQPGAGPCIAGISGQNGRGDRTPPAAPTSAATTTRSHGSRPSTLPTSSTARPAATGHSGGERGRGAKSDQQVRQNSDSNRGANRDQGGGTNNQGGVRPSTAPSTPSTADGAATPTPPAPAPSPGAHTPTPSASPTASPGGSWVTPFIRP